MLGSSATGIGCLTPLFVGGAIFLGRWLDAALGTHPYILLSLILMSIPLSLLVIVRTAVESSRIEAARFHTSTDNTRESRRDYNAYREDT